MTFKFDDAKISNRLRAIAKSVGGRIRADFVILPPTEPVDIDLGEKELGSLFHPSGLLVHRGKPVFVYIRDNTITPPPYAPEMCRKVHFAVCETITYKKSVGQFESRYRITNSRTNEYLIDVTGRSSRSIEMRTLLYPCQNCLALVAYHGFNVRLSMKQRLAIVKAFDAEEAYMMNWRILQKYWKQMKAPTAAKSTGYSKNWPKISRVFRKRMGYECHDCGVVGYSITDTHHIDGDKSNNNFENLQCLCKLCHKGKHPHYPVTEAQRKLILKKRDAQK